jgi:hypothetical protein
MQASGNHGRSSDDPPPTGIGNLVPSTTPQQSVRSFVSPSSMPIKKTPDITDIIGEREKGEGRKETEEQGGLSENQNNESETQNSKPETKNNFNESWRTMFNHVFASIPTIYIPLKESLPKIENNVILVTVKNDVQKEHFEAKTREVLEFLRSNFTEQIEDVVVKTNEQLETKKIIYDVKEKLQNFKEQNSEIDDFIQILELKIKD